MNGVYLLERIKNRFGSIDPQSATILLNPAFLLCCAFLIRVVGIVFTIAVGNPFGEGQAGYYGDHAERAAENLREGEPIGFDVFGGTTERLGTLLFPFWLLPGPSELYTQIVNALIGTLAIYNVYVLARTFHSRLAGSIVILPLAFFPSWIFMHSTLQREATLLFVVTAAIRLFIVPPDRKYSIIAYLLAIFCLAFAVFMRADNAIVFGAVLVIGVWHFLVSSTRSVTVVGLVTGVLTLIGAMSLQRLQPVIEELAEIRARRARGRTVYLPEYIPETVPEAVMFSWIGAIYFMFVPFPWMIEATSDLIVGIEAFVTLVLAIISFRGIQLLYRRAPTLTIALLAGLVVGSIGYGLGTANVGTAIRHRQGLQWIIFLFGAVALADRFGIDVARYSDLGKRSSRDYTRKPSRTYKRRP